MPWCRWWTPRSHRRSEPSPPGAAVELPRIANAKAPPLSCLSDRVAERTVASTGPACRPTSDTIRLPVKLPAEKAELPPHAGDVSAPSRLATISSPAPSPTAWTATGNALGVERAHLPDRPVVLDLASGTGDFSLLVQQRYPGSRPVAVDLTERMLQLARARGLPHAVCADAGALPFPDASFDCVFIGYGLRNFPNLEAGPARNRTRHPARRPARQPRLLPARQPAAAPAVSGLPLRAGHFLGIRAARPAARLHLHPRFAPLLRLH